EALDDRVGELGIVEAWHGNLLAVRGTSLLARRRAAVRALEQLADRGAVEGARVPVRVGDREVGGAVERVGRQAQRGERARRADRAGQLVQALGRVGGTE